MKFGSLFSGIGGFDLGFTRAGMECEWQVEIDANCLNVLEHHYPEVKRYRDVKECGKENLEPVDLICGGFPCQDLSVAGKRTGLAGERSGLWFEFHRIIEELRPGWVVIENVPGLLSSNRGKDFAVILRGLVECGYGVSWRVLDAQYFGVAQRRRRVFIIGSLGDGRAAQVLFESEGGAWDTAPSREAGAGVARAIARSSVSSGYRYDANGEDFVIAHETGKGFWTEGLPGLRGQPGGMPENVIAYTIQQNDGGDHKRKDRPNGGMYVNETDTALTVGSTDMTIMAWHENKGGSFTPSDHVKALRSGASHSYQGVGVRRLTPTECERLQGFPDGWTAGQADSVRYRQLGNAVAVPVIEWIGRRLMEIEKQKWNRYYLLFFSALCLAQLYLDI